MSCETNLQIAKTCRELEVKVAFNPSPYQEGLKDVIQLCDLVILNQFEAQQFSGQSCATSKLALVVAKELGEDKAVVISLGAAGAVFANNSEGGLITAPIVTPIDTTGAGDRLAGVLVGNLASGLTLRDSVKDAVEKATKVTLFSGANEISLQKTQT